MYNHQSCSVSTFFSGDISENILETVVLFHSGMLGKNQPGAKGQQQMIKRVYQQEFYKYWFKLAFKVALEASCLLVFGDFTVHSEAFHGIR